MPKSVLDNVPEIDQANDTNVAEAVAKSIREIGANTDKAFDESQRTMKRIEGELEKIRDKGGADAGDVEKLNRELLEYLTETKLSDLAEVVSGWKRHQKTGQGTGG